jgi:type IV fimbrial biogenesis protein FimT
MKTPLRFFSSHVRCNTAHRQRGVTLVEIVIALAIVSILMGSVPSLADYLKAARVKSATSELFSALLLARSEAAKTNSRVVVCKSSDGDSCAAGGGWEQGWIVFADVNGNGLHEAGEPVVHRGEPVAGALRMNGNSTVVRYVSYTPEGLAKLVGGGFQAGTITICSASLDATEARQIIVNSGGRPRVRKDVVDVCA